MYCIASGIRTFAHSYITSHHITPFHIPDGGPDHETEGTSIDYMAESKGPLYTAPFRAPFWATKFNKSEFVYRGVTGDRAQGFWWNEVGR